MSSLSSEHYSPRPFSLLNPVHSMASESNYVIVHSSILSPITKSWCCANSRVLCKLKERAPSSTLEENLQPDFNHSLRLTPQCIAFSSIMSVACGSTHTCTDTHKQWSLITLAISIHSTMNIYYMTSYKPTSVRNRPGYIRTAGVYGVESVFGHVKCVQEQ